jgi:hypothetical protein
MSFGPVRRTGHRRTLVDASLGEEAEMKRCAVVAMIGSLSLLGCGGDDEGGSVQADLAELLLEDATSDVDEACVRDRTIELSDDQAQFLIDNIDSESTEGFDAALQVWVERLNECLVVPEETGDRGRFNDETDGVRAAVADCFVREASDGSRRYSTTVEVDNDSGGAQLVTVAVVSDLGWGGVSDTFEVPAGGQDAWGITSEEATTEEVGDVDCADYISSIVVTVESPA